MEDILENGYDVDWTWDSSNIPNGVIVLENDQKVN